jgi:hypothetical protein
MSCEKEQEGRFNLKSMELQLKQQQKQLKEKPSVKAVTVA